MKRAQNGIMKQTLREMMKNNYDKEHEENQVPQHKGQDRLERVEDYFLNLTL